MKVMIKHIACVLVMIFTFMFIKICTIYAIDKGNLVIDVDGFNMAQQYRFIFHVKLEKDGKPLTGTFNIESDGTLDSESITLDEEGEATIKMRGKNNKKKFEIIILDVPFGTNYNVDASTENTRFSGKYEELMKESSIIKKLSDTKGIISNNNHKVQFDIKCKWTEYVVKYEDLPLIVDYDMPELIVKTVFHAYDTEIPEDIRYDGAASGTMNKSLDGIDFNTEFNLKKGEEVTFYLPYGMQLFTTATYETESFDRFTKQYNSGLNFSYSDASSGAMVAEKPVYSYVITPSSFSNIIIEKKTNGKGIDPNKKYKFKISMESPNLDGNYKKMNGSYFYTIRDTESNEVVDEGRIKFNDGIAYAELKDKQTITISGNTEYIKMPSGIYSSYKPIDINLPLTNGLPRNVRYKVEEVESDDYVVTSSTKIDGKDYITGSKESSGIFKYVGLAIFTNERNFNGKLILSKKINGDIPSDEEFTFNIKLTDNATDIPTEFKYTGDKEGIIKFEDGLGTITLKGGESITIEGLPFGSNYEITEDSSKYEVTSENEKGKVSANTIVIFTNKKEEHIDNPNTVDSIIKYVIIGLISLITIIVSLRHLKRINS